MTSVSGVHGKYSVYSVYGAYHARARVKSHARIVEKEHIMPIDGLTHDSLLTHLRLLVQCYGTQQAVADEMGISKELLSRILSGKIGVSARVAKRMGFKRIVVYVERDREDAI